MKKSELVEKYVRMEREFGEEWRSGKRDLNELREKVLVIERLGEVLEGLVEMGGEYDVGEGG